MPKKEIPPDLTAIKPEALIILARSKLALTMEPEDSSLIIFFKIYRVLEATHDEGISIEFNDVDILRTLDQHRYQLIPGDIKSERLNFDFALSCGVKVEGSTYYHNLASYALKYKHVLTFNTLIREEHASWGKNLKKIINGSAQEISQGTTWFHMMLILASRIYTQYRAEPSKQAELKEFLQSLMQEFTDVLQEHLPINKEVHVTRLQTFFVKLGEPLACALACIKPFLKVPTAFDMLPYNAAISSIIQTYGLTTIGLLERKNRLDRLAAGEIAEEDRPLLKKYLKTRLNLSAIMLDRMMFEECLGRFGRLHLETFSELIIDLFITNQSDALAYLLHSLSREQAKDLLDYLFEVMKAEPVEQYVRLEYPAPDKATLERNIAITLKGIYDVINTVFEIAGNYQYQLNYLYASMDARLPAEDLSTGEGLVISNTAWYLCIFLPIFKDHHKITASGDEVSGPVMAELRNYPVLLRTFSGKLSSFHSYIQSSLEVINKLSDTNLGQICRDIWRCYLYMMWVECNELYLPTLEVDKFQILDYWLEHLFKNQKEYPKLYAQMTEELIKSHYFSNRKLEYFFKYRFGEHRAISKKISLEEYVVRKNKGVAEFEPTPFVEALHVFKIANKSDLLIAGLDTALESKKTSIYAQFDFVKEWVAWASIKSTEEGSAAVDAKSLMFEFMLSYLMQRTPFSNLIKQYALHVEHVVLADAGVEYLISLLDDEARFAAIDSSVFMESLSFNKDSARATLLLILFVCDFSTKTKYYTKLADFVGLMLITLSNQFDKDPTKTENYLPFFEEIAQHGFFKREIGSGLIHFIYNHFYISLPTAVSAVESLSTATALLTDEKKISRSMATETADALESDSEEEDATSAKPKPKSKSKTSHRFRRRRAKKLTGSTFKPVETPYDAPLSQSVVVAAAAGGAGARALSDITDTVLDTSDTISSLSDTTEHSTTSIIDNIAVESLRKLRQELSKTIDQLVQLLNKELTTLAEGSSQFVQYQKLLSGLQKNQTVSLALRKILKEISSKESAAHLIKEESSNSEAGAFDLIEQHQALVEKMYEQATELDFSDNVVKLIGKLKIPTHEDFIQHYLNGRLKLPLMPVVKLLAELFAEHARLYVYGSALFLSDPLDIDLRLVWKDPAVPIAVINDIFTSLIVKSGFEVKIHRDLIGGSTFTLKAKGDGYGMHDHKELDITLHLADLTSRPVQHHHNSHSAAALEVATGYIHCDPAFAKDIINATFSIKKHEYTDPVEAFKAQVQILAPLMRAWFASRAGELKLDRGAIDLINKIKKHHGDWASLNREDLLLGDALRGMIVRHFAHYQPSVTYRWRTHILISFLDFLEITSLAPYAAIAVKEILSTDLSSYKPGMTSLHHTDAYFDYCKGLSLPIASFLKIPLTKVLAQHFAIYKEGENYLAKTSLLLAFCAKHGFRLMAKIDSSGEVCLVEFDTNFRAFSFSKPTRVDDSADVLLFEPNLLLVKANERTIVQAKVRQKMTQIAEPPAHPTMAAMAAMPAMGKAHGGAASAISTVYFPTAASVYSGPGLFDPRAQIAKMAGASESALAKPGYSPPFFAPHPPTTIPPEPAAACAGAGGGIPRGRHLTLALIAIPPAGTARP